MTERGLYTSVTVPTAEPRSSIGFVFLRRMRMPVKKVKGGYKYGTKGKVYKTKKQAERQGRAIKASQNRRKKK